VVWHEMVPVVGRAPMVLRRRGQPGRFMASR